MSRTRCLIAIATVVLLVTAAGCLSGVERNSRAQSLDIRVPDPNERMYNARPNAKPVHETTGCVDLTRPITLSRATDIALESHPEIRRAQARIDGAIARTKELETMGWAEFLTDITYSTKARMFVGTPTTTGDVLRPGATRFGLALRQPLYFEWQRRRAYLNANNEEIAKLQAEMQIQKNKVVAEVCKAFLELTQTRQQYDCRRAVYHLDQKRVATVKRLVEKGLLISPSTYKAIGFMEAARRDAEAAYGVLQSKERVIKNILGIDSRLQVKIQPIEFDEIPIIPPDEATDYLTNNSMEFRVLDHEVEKAYWEKVLGRWMDIDLDLWVRYGYDLQDFRTSADDFLTVSLSFRYPLLHVKARNARVVRGLKRMEEFEIEREVQQQRLLNDLETLYSTIEENRADMESDLAGIDEAKENLRIAQIFEQKGTTDESLKSDPDNVLLPTISAIAMLNSRFDYEKARLKYLSAIMDQYVLLGRAAELREFAHKYNPEELFTAQSRSILVTETGTVLDSPDMRKQLFDFCRIENISTIYLRVEPAQFALETLQDFLKEAHAHRLGVAAVMGDEAWLDAPTTEAAESALNAFFNFQKQAGDSTAAAVAATQPPTQPPAPHRAFTALHIDFHGKRLGDFRDSAAWPESRKERLLNIIAYAGKTCKEMNIPLGFSVAGAASGYAIGDKLLYAALAESCNTICLYLHSNNQSDIVAITDAILKKLPAGCKVKVAMETADSLPPSQSYFQQGTSLMWGESIEVSEKLAGNSNFTGIVIDNYHNLLAMQK
jgi:outer membrane protein TolC